MNVSEGDGGCGYDGQLNAPPQTRGGTYGTSDIQGSS